MELLLKHLFVGGTGFVEAIEAEQRRPQIRVRGGPIRIEADGLARLFQRRLELPEPVVVD
jgi:hypothetical protein